MIGTKKPSFSLEFLRSILRYDPESGALIRLVGRGSQKAGAVAGSVSGPGYVYVQVGARMYLSHRLIWWMQTGRWPRKEIDHKDEDKTNNKWSNLRLATRSQNQCNVGLSRNNTSGAKGVSLSKERGDWRAYISINGSRKDIGRYPTREQAIAARVGAEKRLHGKFARRA